MANNNYTQDFINNVKGSLNTGVSEEAINKSVNDYLDKNPITSEIIYSTEERVIGRWVDGKPIYQKTVQLKNLTSYDLSDTPINLVIKIEGMIKDDGIGDVICFAPDYSGETYAVRTYYSTINKKIMIFASEALHTHQSAYITIQYTKTTD